MQVAIATSVPASGDTSGPTAATSAAAAMLPNVSPTPTCDSARANVVNTMRRGFAPSASRMPISDVRRDTVNDISA